MKKLHTFAVCAYKESPFLEECICSLLAQTVPADIVIATSTPNDYIDQIADTYNLPVIVINDCSKDNTLELCRENGIPVLDLPVNLGIGGAVQTGYLYAL